MRGPRKGKKSTKGQFQVQDRFFHEAKAKGYLSRAAFKLLEIQEKYRIFKPGQRILDLGAAPGGWSQMALKAIGRSGQVMGVDLQDRPPLKETNFTYYQGDIGAEATLAAVRAAFEQVDVVLSDLAPSISGIKFQDQHRSYELVAAAFQLAQELLKPGGSLICKTFPGEDFSKLKREIVTAFERVEDFVPMATRKTSKEIYLVALGAKKGPVLRQAL